MQTTVPDFPRAGSPRTMISVKVALGFSPLTGSLPRKGNYVMRFMVVTVAGLAGRES